MQSRETLVGRAQWLALLCLVVLAYWPSWQAPFYFDDFRIIVENPAIRDIGNIAAVWEFSPERVIGTLTFAANYVLHGDSVFGYRLLNVAIHLMAGIALWLLLKGLLNSPAIGAEHRGQLRWLPFLAAAIFLLHPLQTQAVTYIVQRFASLAALFYLGGLAAYVWARLHRSKALFAASAGLFVLALFTKQNAVTWPLSLLLVEAIFFRRLNLAQRGLAAGLAALTLVGSFLLVSYGPQVVQALTRETDAISRSQYLATQMGVVWHYIGLFFVPTGLRLEYDVPVVASWMRWDVLAMAAAHLAAIAGGFALWRRLPLVAFGVLFYYLAHLVESSFIPISDFAFEHRTYLPNAGLVVTVGLPLAWAVGRCRPLYAAWLVPVAVLAPLLWLTAERNALWADRIAFLQNETTLSPQDKRAWTSLGKELMRDGQFEQALQAFDRALALGRTERQVEVPASTLINKMLVLHYLGRDRRALELSQLIPVHGLTRVQKSRLYEGRGRAYLAIGSAGQARRNLKQAVRAYPSANSLAFLAQAELREGARKAARRHARAALRIIPDHPLAKNVLLELERSR